MSDIGDDMASSDRILMEALARAVGSRRPPADLLAQCEGLLGWMDVDSELAALLDQPVAEAVGTRGTTASPAMLEFAVEDGSCVIELTSMAGVLAGQLLGSDAVAVVVRTMTGVTASSPIDEVGEFEINDAPSGTIRLEFELADGRTIRTDWFVS